MTLNNDDKSDAIGKPWKVLTANKTSSLSRKLNSIHQLLLVKYEEDNVCRNSFQSAGAWVPVGLWQESGCYE